MAHVITTQAIYRFLIKVHRKIDKVVGLEPTTSPHKTLAAMLSRPIEIYTLKNVEYSSPLYRVVSTPYDPSVLYSRIRYSSCTLERGRTIRYAPSFQACSLITSIAPTSYKLFLLLLHILIVIDLYYLFCNAKVRNFCDITKYISNFFLLINVNLYLYLIKYAIGVNMKKGRCYPTFSLTLRCSPTFLQSVVSVRLLRCWRTCSYEPSRCPRQRYRSHSA